MYRGYVGAISGFTTILTAFRHRRDPNGATLLAGNAGVMIPTGLGGNPRLNATGTMTITGNQITQTVSVTVSGSTVTLSFSGTLTDSGSETQAEFSALVQQTWTSYSTAVGNWMQQGTKAVPLGSN
jgi:hypothetical protein